MFTFQEKLLYYQGCPFGASFSQHWWGRIGSFLMFFFSPPIIHQACSMVVCG
jgi:hypothetical protein